MRKILVLVIGLFFLTTSCSKQDAMVSEPMYEATILGSGMDCSDAFLIQFKDKINSLPPSTDNIYYEINLPDEYKVPGLTVLVAFREPNLNEYMMCTTLGPGYPQIFIVKAD
ncbi:MAG: hypothetical protein R2750_12845 [Bacteroidales bacterium]